MKKSILITGVSGSGKSSICGEFIKRGYRAYDIDDVEGLFEMRDKRTGKVFDNYDNYDFEKVRHHDWVCDKDKLQKLIQKNRNGITYYCGAASNIDEILPLFDKIFLLTASPKVLCERLSTRTSNDFGRTSEVQKWILDLQKQWEDHISEKGAISIDANRDLQEVTDDIIKRSNHYISLRNKPKMSL